jgi:hypothetical protein
MQVGPRIPREYSYKGLKLAQLLGQLGVFLACVNAARSPSTSARYPSSLSRASAFGAIHDRSFDARTSSTTLANPGAGPHPASARASCSGDLARPGLFEAPAFHRHWLAHLATAACAARSAAAGSSDGTGSETSQPGLNAEGFYTADANLEFL